jgi:serine/threonine protein kinase
VSEWEQLLHETLGDRYEVKRELGRGGMSVVYVAYDRRVDRPVALKVLRPEHAASLWAARFLREIEIASRLAHPHIVPLLDSAASDGLLYYTMPYLEGESLRTRLDRVGHLALDDAISVTCEVADALGYAHEQGIVHRDIKPGNILFAEHGAMVADFGIARAITAAGGEALTLPGLPLGTMGYMSPEQAAGVTELDGRTDIYSLACVLHEMLAGRPPRTSMDGARSEYTGRPSGGLPDVGSIEDAPDEVICALARALSLHPGDRFPTAQAFVGALTTPRSIHPAVAVLPFTNVSSDPGNDLLGTAVARTVIQELKAGGDLTVASHSASFAYRNACQDVRSIAAALNVGAVVEGSVRRAGDILRVTAQLVAGDSGSYLWSEHFDCAVGDPASVWEEIARAIAEETRALILTAAHPEGVPPADGEESG